MEEEESNTYCAPETSKTKNRSRKMISLLSWKHFESTVVTFAFYDHRVHHKLKTL